MRTALFPQHQKNGAKFLNFAGYEMPLQYEGILSECHAVRHKAGLFDVSHMGAIKISGIDTVPFLNLISTNIVLNKPFGKVFYTVLCDDQGGAIDDLLLALLSPHEALMIVNASNRQHVLQHLQKVMMRFQVELSPLFETHGILSLQGPLSSSYIGEIFPTIKLKSKEITTIGKDSYLSRTGYTGEDGYEIIGPNEMIFQVWEKLLHNQKELKLCGLGARDLLRLEMGYALYGHELSLNIKPIESVAAWAVKLENHDFIGKHAQLQLLNSDHCRKAVGLVGLEPPIARENAPIFISGKQEGYVTSGSYSPQLKAPIALALVNEPLKRDQIVQIEIRKELVPFKVSALPFIQIHK